MAIFFRNRNVREMRNVYLMEKYLVDSYSCFSNQLKIQKSFSADSLEAGLVFLSFSSFRSLEKLKDICNVLSEVKSSRGPKGINSTGNRVHSIFDYQVGYPN
jgi:hypothetical protein